jgi:hypothetical protein
MIMVVHKTDYGRVAGAATVALGVTEPRSLRHQEEQYNGLCRGVCRGLEILRGDGGLCELPVQVCGCRSVPSFFGREAEEDGTEFC